MTITDRAKEQIQPILKQNPGASLRVMIAGFG
jgi:Fe-S cluster assembly iron-binding protein IscA